MKLCLALGGMTVKEMLARMDSEELTEWQEYDKRWPLPDSWWQTARVMRTIMAASGNYKRLPDESKLIPSAIRPEQSQESIVAEFSKLVKRD